MDGESTCVPSRVLVHDPASSGALDGEVPPLFRAVPRRDAWAREHAAFVAAIAAAGVDVLRLGDLADVPDNPNHVYTRDAAITLPWLPGVYVAGSMRMPERRGEVAVVAAALRALGLRELFALPPDAFLEGGDVIPYVHDGRRGLLVGFGPRSSRQAIDLLFEALELDEIVGVELSPTRMNLDGVLVPVAEDVAVAHPGSIERAFLRDSAGERPVDVLDLWRARGHSIVEVTREEATERQATNCLALGGRRVVCYDLAPRVVGELRTCGLDVRPVPGSELIKGTGGPRCMSRPLYDEVRGYAR